MESTLIAVDTAKLVFEVAESGLAGKVQRRLRLNRQQFFRSIWRPGNLRTSCWKPVAGRIIGRA